MPQDPVTHLRALIEKYTVISFLPDIASYHRITGPVTGTCIFRGCSEPVAWEDARGGNHLCEGHYVIMKRWIDEARQGLITGKHGALFEPETPRK